MARRPSGRRVPRRGLRGRERPLGAGVAPLGLPLSTPATATPARIAWVVDRGPGWAYHEERIEGSDYKSYDCIVTNNLGKVRQSKAAMQVSLTYPNSVDILNTNVRSHYRSMLID